MSMRSIVRRLARRCGYEITRNAGVPSLAIDPISHGADRFSDLSPSDKGILSKVQPFTMTSPERLAAQINAVAYLVKFQIPGDFVECGVWRGGSMMAAAMKLLQLGDTSRRLYMYDTYEGMTPPTEVDVSFDGQSAEAQQELALKMSGAWCDASIEEVRRNLFSTGYPIEQMHFVKGRVEDTVPVTLPGHIALLRLDTDWYESTRHELLHMYPLLDPAGILIIDDYGHWRGSQQAVDEYFAARSHPVYLHRVDYTARVIVGGPARAIPSAPSP